MSRKPQENLDPLKIFSQADNFILAHHVLLMQREDYIQSTTYAAMILSAFASELYMKTFICLEGKGVPPWHDLNELFSQISVERRLRIEHFWNGQTIKNEKRLKQAEKDLQATFPRTLSDALKAGGDTFKKLRYAYEEGSKNNVYVLGELPACLRKVLIEIKPGWRAASGNHEVMQSEDR